MNNQMILESYLIVFVLYGYYERNNERKKITQTIERRRYVFFRTTGL
jgi:hypothetical protein